MEQDGDSPPTFWFQPPIQPRRRPSPLFNPVVLIILLPILFLLIIFFLLPPLLTHTSQIIKPTSVKKSWDSLNVFLVLFAVICGVFTRRNDDDDVLPPPTDGVDGQVNHGYHRNREMYSSSSLITAVREPVTGGSGLRRNSSSYPDFRQETPWETGENQFRFLDDFDVNLHSSASRSAEYSHLRRRRSEVERDNIAYLSPASSLRSEVVEKENGLHRSQSAVSTYFHDVPRRREVERDNDVYRSPPPLRQSETEIGNGFHQSQSAVSDYFHDFPCRLEVERDNDVYRSLPPLRRSEAEIENVFHQSESAVNFQNAPQRNELEKGDDAYQSPPSLRRSELERDYSEVKEIPVETFQVHRYPTSPFPPKSPAPQPPPLPPVAKFKPRNSYHNVRRKEKVRIKNESEAEYEKPRPPPPAPPPPPPPPPRPPPPPPIVHRSETKLKKLDRQISDATKEIATAFTSLYNQRKRKKKSRTRTIHDDATLSPQSSQSSPEQIAPLPPPPPPPLPPPPSVFKNMFKKGTKHKRIHSVAAAAPPPSPPPLPPSSIFNNLFKSGGKSKRFSSSAAPPPPPPPPPPSFTPNNIFKSGSKSKRNSSGTSPPPPPPLPPPLLKAVSVCTNSDDPIVSTQYSRRKSRVLAQSPPPVSNPPDSEQLRRRPSSKGKPPLPSKPTNYYEREEYTTNSGSQSPLFPIPPPPPPPPFKMSELKFKIRGDFISLRSAQSSVCNSPDRESIDFSGMQESLEELDGGDVVVGSAAFPPSPDVNVEADSFISRLKDEWRKEKVNSVRARQKMGHGILGLGPGLSPK